MRPTTSYVTSNFHLDISSPIEILVDRFCDLAHEYMIKPSTQTAHKVKSAYQAYMEERKSGYIESTVDLSDLIVKRHKPIGLDL